MIRIFFLCAALFAGACSRATDSFSVDGIEFFCRVPSAPSAESRIMVLFGGRNWPGDKTIQNYQFDRFADRNRIFLLSPSFRDREYWQPEKWSGNTLRKAVGIIEKKYRIPTRKLLLYGYSAGGQCAALFAAWMPENVAAWGAHACGVFPEKTSAPVPALVTCGREDEARFAIGRDFVYRYREADGALLWKPFPGGHGLSPEALELARTWFEAILSGRKIQEYGEDDTMRINRNIDMEFRNPLYNDKIRELWLK